MTPEKLDVPPERNAKYLEGIRRMSAAQRGAVLDGMVRDSRALLMAGIQMRHPELTPEQVRWRVCEALYGSAFTTRVLGQR